MNILAASYSALKGPRGQAQTGREVVERLAERLASATLLEDRRAAVLGLKGLARDWQLVGLGLAVDAVCHLLIRPGAKWCRYAQTQPTSAQAGGRHGRHARADPRAGGGCT
jgi:hypothetical protein